MCIAIKIPRTLWKLAAVWNEERDLTEKCFDQQYGKYRYSVNYSTKLRNF